MSLQREKHFSFVGLARGGALKNNSAARLRRLLLLS
jgi:hypothetical protein